MLQTPFSSALVDLPVWRVKKLIFFFLSVIITDAEICIPFLLAQTTSPFPWFLLLSCFYHQLLSPHTVSSVSQLHLCSHCSYLFYLLFLLSALNLTFFCFFHLFLLHQLLSFTHLFYCTYLASVFTFHILSGTQSSLLLQASLKKDFYLSRLCIHACTSASLFLQGKLNKLHFLLSLYPQE